MATHRVVAEVTIKVVLDVDKDNIDAEYPSDEYNDQLEMLVQNWSENTRIKLSDTNEATIVGMYTEMEYITIKSK